MVYIFNRLERARYLVLWLPWGYSPKDDLWIKYFTSSKYVTEFCRLNGDPDVIVVDKIFKTKKEAQHYEDLYLKERHAVQSENWLNRSRAGKEFRSPDQFSEESREKMRIARKRNGNTRKKPFSDAERERARRQIQKVNALGIRAPWTPERRKKLSESAKGNQARTGMRNSPEHRSRISAAKKKTASIRASCVKCRREMSLIGMKKHLSTVCFQPTKKSTGSE